MKKLYVLLSCVLVCSLLFSGCGLVGMLIENSRKPAATVPVETEPATTVATVPQEMTFEEFLERSAGLWLLKDTIQPMGSDYRFDFMSFTVDSCVIGWYPGEFDRPGKFGDFQGLTADSCQVELLYAAGEYMGAYYPESRRTLTVTFGADGALELQFDAGEPTRLVYGGASLEEARVAAGRIYLEG